MNAEVNGTRRRRYSLSQAVRDYWPELVLAAVLVAVAALLPGSHKLVLLVEVLISALAGAIWLLFKRETWYIPGVFGVVSGVGLLPINTTLASLLQLAVLAGFAVYWHRRNNRPPTTATNGAANSGSGGGGN